MEKKRFEHIRKMLARNNSSIVMNSYLRRSSIAYEKIIARSKYPLFPPV